jgi:hypothetical protein
MPFNSLFAWIIKKRIHQIALFKQYPWEVQEELLHKLLRTAEDTNWGTAHQFSSLNGYEDFKKALPLTDYTTIKPSIDQMMDGEKNVFWPGETKWFAKSSGTTAARSKCALTRRAG